MNREKSRQLQRLLRLADFIEKNPQKYVHARNSTCIIGLGLRMNFRSRKGKLESPNVVWDSCSKLDTFANRYGVSKDTANSLYWAYFSEINPKMKDYGFGHMAGIKAKTAVTALRHIAKKQMKQFA